MTCAEDIWFPVLDHSIIALFCNPQVQEFYLELLVAQFTLKIKKKKTHRGLLTETEVSYIPHGRIMVHNSVLLISRVGWLHSNHWFQIIPASQIFWESISWPRQNT